jgi:Carboxypeptidase regulatory-like domain/TonB-dependent Receptor Plug Domain
MRRSLGLVRILLALTSLAIATTASAQVQSGSILVKANDAQGGVLPGAAVTLTSSLLPTPMTSVTDTTGVTRFTSLPVGTYTVKIALPGFQTTNREGVVVLQSQTITLDFELKVSTVAEEVTVKAESPVIDVKSASVNVNLDSKLLETTPGGKDIWNILEYKIPGLVFNTPDVGGNQGGLQRDFTSRGTPNSQNVQLLNGVNVNDPAAIGFSMNYYEPSTFENINVTTGAQDISMGTAGTLINMVTRSGTNVFGGETLATYQGDKTQWDNIDEHLFQSGFRPNAQSTGLLSNYNAQAGGPLIKNKLFWFGSFNDQRTHVNVPGYPAISLPQIPQLLSGNTQDTTDIDSITGKMTESLNAANRVEVYGNYQWYKKPNRGASATTTLDSNNGEDDTFAIFQAGWNTVVGGRWFGDTKLNYNNTHFPLYQKTNLQPITDNSTNIRYRNNTNTALMFRRRLQFTSNWQYSIPRFFGGRHDFKTGIDNAYTPEDVTTSRVDNVTLTFRSVAGNANQPAGPGQVTIFNTPTLVKRAVSQTSLYGQDQYSIGRLTVIGGIRWERIEGYIPPQTHESSQYFPSGTTISGLNVALNTGGTLTTYVVKDSFDAVHNAPLWKNWAPRVSGTYDLTGRGKLVLKASMGKYLDQIGTGTPGPNPNGGVSQTYAWNDSNGDLVFQPGNASWDGTKYVGGEFGALANNGTSIPNPNPFDPTIIRTSRNEFTVGLDQELFPGLRLSTTFIHRRDHNPQGTVDSDVAGWDSKFTQIPVKEPGRDGVFNTSDDEVIQVYNQNAGITLAPKTVNDDRLATHYNGLEITATKRYSKGWTVLTGYTYSHTRQELQDLRNPNNAFVNTNGESGGRRHNFKISGSYQLPYQITFGANYRISSGLPITRSYNVPQCSATVTSDCVSQANLSVNAEPRGSVELPALGTLDLRAARTFKLNGARIELAMNMFNVSNANTVFSVRQGTGTTGVKYKNDAAQPTTQIATFLSPTGILGPRIISFGITYWFGSAATR